MERCYRKGVGAFLINEDNLIFIGKRIDVDNAWQMPQGGMEENETPEEAIFRELKEEIGTNNAKILTKTPPLKYDLPEEVCKDFWNGKYCGQEQVWFALRFLGKSSDINLNLDGNPEFVEHMWVKATVLLELIVDFKRPLYAEILEHMIKFKVI